MKQRNPRRDRKGRCRRLGIGAVLGALATGADAASLNDQLAEFGHPQTKVCVLDNSTQGLGNLMVLQYPNRPTSAEDETEAVDLLRLLAPALVDAGQRYVGFDARKSWESCSDRYPKYVFWRDHEDNWRYVQGTPQKYLSKRASDLAADRRGTPEEAFVLFSLGLVEQRLGRIPRSIDRYEKAYEILTASGDPDGIQAFVLMPLIHYYLNGEGDDEALGQRYLNAYAAVAESSTSESGEYLPLIKTAPAYPRSAQLTGREGYVLLEFTVDADGKVRDPVVIEESPPGVFGDSAVEAARSFRYIPKVVDGKFVAVPGVRNLITFELAD